MRIRAKKLPVQDKSPQTKKKHKKQGFYYYQGSYDFVFNRDFWDKFLDKKPVVKPETKKIIPDLDFAL